MKFSFKNDSTLHIVVLVTNVPLFVSDGGDVGTTKNTTGIHEE